MGKLKAIGNFLKKKIDPILEKEKIYFCWETFESKRRIFGDLPQFHSQLLQDALTLKSTYG